MDKYSHLDYAVYLIRLKTQRLAGWSAMTPDDQEDFRQELLVHMLQRLPEFDPQRGTAKTFISRAVDNKIRNILEHRRTQKHRIDNFALSLNENVGTSPDSSMERIDTLDSDEHLLQSGFISRSGLETHELGMQVDEVLTRLPGYLRRLCEQLKTQTVTQISQETGVPRHIIYKSIRKLRLIFQSAGFDEYVQK